MSNLLLLSFHRLIRLTSPNLNYITVTGALVFYASVYFVVHPEVSEDAVTVFCNVSIFIWVLTIIEGLTTREGSLGILACKLIRLTGDFWLKIGGGIRLQEEILYILLTNRGGYIDCSYHSDCKKLSNRIMTSELETTGSLSIAFWHDFRIRRFVSEKLVSATLLTKFNIL